MKPGVLLLLILVSAPLGLLAGGIAEEEVAGMVADAEYNRMLLGLLDGRAEPIGVEEARRLKQGGGALFLDARTKEEFAVSRIPGALFIGYKEPEFQALDGADKSQVLIVYCSVGYRSERIAAELAERGFRSVVNLYGGIFEWRNRGFALENEQGETWKLHGYEPRWGRWVADDESLVY